MIGLPASDNKPVQLGIVWHFIKQVFYDSLSIVFAVVLHSLSWC